VGAADEPHPLARLLPEFKRQYGEIWLDLGAVSEREGRAFVNAYLETEPNALTDAFQEELFQHTGGHPLFTVELLRDLQERGDLVRDASGVWVQGQTLDWSQLPPRVEGVIEARLNRLPVELREALEIAAVEGEEFTLEVVAQVLGQPERRVIDHLNQALGRQHRLVRPSGSKDIEGQRLHSYQFRHALFQQHLYQALPHAKRELLHDEVGGALEGLYAGQTEEVAPLLARHFWAADARSRALLYLLTAGDQALQLYAQQEAAEFYQRAVEVLTAERRLEEAANTLLKLGQAYHTASDYPAAREAYERAFALRQQIEGHRAELLPAQRSLQLAWLEPKWINSDWEYSAATVWYLKLIFSGLVDIHRAEYPAPGVARAWQVSPDGRRYTFTLRRDARWSDGQPVTAEDFAFTWKLRLDPHKNRVSVKDLAMYHLLYAIKGAREFRQGLETNPETVAVHAKDEFTLEVELVQPNSFFLQSLKSPSFLPMPKHIVERYGPAWTEPGNLVTNGPFGVEEWRPGMSMRLRRNSHYYGEFPGNLEMVDIKLVQDVRSREMLAMYVRDELDFIDLGLQILGDRHNFPGEYLQRQNGEFFYLQVNFMRSPMDDRRVRRALGLAIDKQALVDQAYQGLISPASGGFVPPGFPGHSPGIGLPYDPDRARRLLAQAGFANGSDFPGITLAVMGHHLPTGEYLQRQWADILNIGVEIKTVSEFGAFYSLSNESDLSWYPVHTTGGDPESFLGEGLIDHAGFHHVLAEARRCQDQQQRLQIYQQADRLLIDEAVALPLAYGMEHSLVKPWVRNWDFWNLHQVILEPH
jgi:ABC-type oligopeptide transport system substrate-binding subunit